MAKSNNKNSKIDKKFLIILVIIAFIASLLGFVLFFYAHRPPRYYELPDQVKESLKHDSTL